MIGLAGSNHPVQTPVSMPALALLSPLLPVVAASHGVGAWCGAGAEGAVMTGVAAVAMAGARATSAATTTENGVGIMAAEPCGRCTESSSAHEMPGHACRLHDPALTWCAAADVSRSFDTVAKRKPRIPPLKRS